MQLQDGQRKVGATIEAIRSDVNVSSRAVFVLEGDSSSPSFSIMYLGSKMPRHNLAVSVVWHAYDILYIHYTYIFIFFNLFYGNCREFCPVDLLYGGGDMISIS